MPNKPLHKTTVVIWSELDVADLDLLDLVCEVTEGGAYCAKHVTVRVEDPEHDGDWDGTDFFDEEPKA